MSKKTTLLLSSAIALAAVAATVRSADTPKLTSADVGEKVTDLLSPQRISRVMRVNNFSNRATLSPSLKAEGEGNVIFSETFPTYDAFAAWTILDKNNDLTCWDWTDEFGTPFVYCYGTMYDYYDMLTANDWIISPDVNLIKDHAYRVVVNVGMCGYTEEKVEVFLGTGKSVDNLTLPAIESTVITEDMAYGADLSSDEILISDDAVYNIGIHMISEPASDGIVLYSVTVYDLGLRDPDAFVPQRIYLEQFESKTAFDSFTVYNINGDSGEWKYNTSNKCARYNYNSKNTADDWLITPDLGLQVGRDYKLVFKTSTASEPERIEVSAGSSNKVADFTTTLMSPTDLPKYTSGIAHEVTFKLTADAPYHIGFHAISDPDCHNLDIDDIEIWDMGPNGDEPITPDPPTPEGLAIPYDANMRDAAVFAQYTVIDANDDGRSWIYDIIFNSTLYNFSKTEAADDWLISPYLKLEEGKAYKLLVEIKSRGIEFPEKFEAKIGTGMNVDDFTIPAIPETMVIMDKDEPSVTYTSDRIQVPETGIYTAGIHVTSDANMSDLEIYRIRVEEVYLDAPKAVTDLKAVADDTGELIATISFNAPTENINGEQLADNLTKIEVYRGDKLITTLVDVAPGSEQTVIDDDTEIINGINQYTVIPFVGQHDGTVAQVNLFIGTDIPMRVTGLTSEDLDNKIKFTWNEVPEIGQNGGVVYPAGVEYHIYAAFPELFMGYIINIEYELLETVTGVSQAIIDYEELSLGEHETIYFGVTASTKAGESAAVHTTMLKGQPLTLPYEESFTNNTIHHYLSYDTDCTDENTGLYFQETSSDDDNSSLCFIAFQNGGRYISIYTAKLDLSTAAKPTLSFDALNTGGHNTLVVDLILPDGSSTEIARFVPDNVEFDNRTIELPDNAKSARWGRLCFTVEYPGYVDEESGNRLNLDNLRLYDAYNSGVEDIEAEIVPVTFPADIYGTDGRLLRRNALSTDGLNGVIIINGHKVVAK